MSEDEVQSPSFKGQPVRTYSRNRQSTSGQDGRSVKAAMSVTKWGKTNYMPMRDSDEAVDAKRIKLENKNEDPFSFETEDKSKKSLKKEVTSTPPSNISTKLPASRINVKDGNNANLSEDKSRSTPVIRTYSRTTPKKPIIMDQFVEVGKISQGEKVLNSSSNAGAIPTPMMLVKNEAKPVKKEEDEDIFPVQFKREPLKTYSGDVVIPVDKPDSPPPKKGYKRKGGPRGRKPLTVTDPDLIEEYKRNWEAQQQKGRKDPNTKGLSNSMVVSKKELSNEEQGTTLVVVCKPKTQLERTEVQTKYFKNVKSTRGLVVPVAPGLKEENGETDVVAEEEAQPTRVSSRLQEEMAYHLYSKFNVSPSTTGSNPSITPASSGNMNTSKSGLSSSQQSNSSGVTDSSLSDPTSSRGGKRYRIFKSRAPQVEDALKPPVFKDDLDENPIPPAVSDSLNSLKEADIEMQNVNEDVQSECVDTEESQPPSLTPDNSSQFSENVQIEAEIEDDLVDTDPGNNKAAVVSNSSAARESLAARLRKGEKDNESVKSDSTDIQDNVSEGSEIFPSQESIGNSQNSEQSEISQKDPVRRFFKSKSKSSSGSGSDLQRKIFGGSPSKSPAKAVYNARSWNNDREKDDLDKEDSVESKTSTKNGKDDEEIVLVKNSSKSAVKREVHWPETKFDEAYTSLRVNKKVRSLYTVVHNVKQTHEVQELGETQDFIDDVDYLLDSLQQTKSKSIRCLSCLKLAGKCIMPAFRMHIRAHGTVTKIFSLLHDACTDPSLALSTSAIMFMLSRDRLNLDLDQDSLSLMLRLNEVDAADNTTHSAAIVRDLNKTKVRVQDLLAQLQQETNAREIDLGFVSTGNLAMESLLSLTSRRAGEWFKEELRTVGGLDHIVDSVVTCEKNLPEDMLNDIDSALPSLRKMDRCLRVLENMSIKNEDNQNYLIAYKDATLLNSCTRTLRLCQAHLSDFKFLENVEENKEVKQLPGYVILTCLLAVLRVLLNITHERALGKFKKSEEMSLMSAIVHCLTATQWCIPIEQRFDLSILSLGLLINMLESDKTNRRKLMDMATQVQYSDRSPPKTMTILNAVVKLFVEREEVAREMEEDADTPNTSATAESPDKSGEWQENDSGIQWITNSLKKAAEGKTEKNKGNDADTSIQPNLGTEKSEETGEGNESILEDDEETFTKALHKAGRHMENSIVASYAALLLGTVIMDDKEYAHKLKELIPNKDFNPMIKILKKFLNFMSLTTAFSSTDVNGITRVINVLEAA